MDLTQKQKDSLVALGLSPLQLKLYLTSLKHGILSVLELSKLIGVNRQQIYHDAEKLDQRFDSITSYIPKYCNAKTPIKKYVSHLNPME